MVLFTAFLRFPQYFAGGFKPETPGRFQDPETTNGKQKVLSRPEVSKEATG